MATRLFRSSLAFRLQCFLEVRKKAGRRGISSQKILMYLDRFLCGELKPGETITREIVERWIKSLESLSTGTRINRIAKELLNGSNEWEWAKKDFIAERQKLTKERKDLEVQAQ